MYDQPGQALLHVRTDQGTLHEWPDHTQMHIKGQRGSRTALRQFLRGKGIAQQAHAPAPQVCGDIETVEPSLAQEGVVFYRIGRLTVVQCRARRKVLCQLPTALLQVYVCRGE